MKPMLKKVAIVIPFYRDTITAYEHIALQQCARTLPAHPIIAIKPESLDLPAEAAGLNLAATESFEDGYFKGLAGYNRLMLSAQFYKRFIDYEYILIYQMDCFVFKDELIYWCSQGYDYIGAPWIKKTYHKNAAELFILKTRQHFSSRFNFKNNDLPNQYQLVNRVGNGGFSLRRVKKFYDLCIIMGPVIDSYLAKSDNLHNEDVFWSIEVNRKKRVLAIPPCETGLRFAYEVPPVKIGAFRTDNMPFGCHDWDHYLDFWRPVFNQYNYTV